MFLQALSILANHNHICGACERNGQSEMLVSKLVIICLKQI